MTAFRIYTEDRSNLADIVADRFTGATIYHTTGIYCGRQEHGAVIEILANSDMADSVRGLARHIAQVNGQAECLVTVSPVSDHFNVRPL